jgi:AraC-like DNA-binding protein
MAEFAPGLAHVISEAGGGEEIRPHPRSHLLGVNVDASVLASHREALAGHWGAPPQPLRPLLRTTTAQGRSLLRCLDWIWRELARPDSLLHTPRVALEVEDTLAGMLVEACSVADAPASGAPSDAAARRAEEFLAENLDRPVSLAQVAKAVDLSTRTLSRVFHERHGTGPIGFLRRRRLEAARRDLLDAEPAKVDVTQVALRYGFDHLGRFAGDYRRVFGELPSETLRS